NSVNSGTITVNTALTIPTISPSVATTYDNGQSITIATYESGGTGPWTYNFLVFNSITNTLLANQLGTSNSFTFTANSFMQLNGNTYKANVLVTDLSANTANSVNSGTITVNTALTIPTISPSVATTYDNGQSITIATYESGGTGPWTYNFLVFNSITNTLLANQLGTSNSFTFTANSFMQLNGNTYKANVLVTDLSANTANSVNSGTITVNTALTIPTISPSVATTYDNGQSITIATYESGGTGPWTYNFLVFNSITNTLLANQLGTSNSFTFTANSFMQLNGNTYKANVLVTDLSANTANSVNSGTITVNTALTTPTISPSVATTYDNGQSITIATYES